MVTDLHVHVHLQEFHLRKHNTILTINYQEQGHLKYDRSQKLTIRMYI